MSDIRGKTVPQILSIAKGKSQSFIEAALLDHEDFLRAHGATQQELEDGLACHRDLLERQLSGHLERMGNWLRNGGELMH